jgi:tetratricopeptide (TPR) repeat protein
VLGSIGSGGFVLVWLVGWVLAAEGTVLPGSDVEIELVEQADVAIEDGLEALAGGRYEEAARQFSALADAGGGAQLRWLEAVARYENGELRGAERAAATGLQIEPAHAQLLDLMGLVLTDLGRGAEGRALIDRALIAARQRKDQELEARALLHLGLAHADEGAYDQARAAWTGCKGLADQLGNRALAEEATAQIASLEGKGGDVVGQVSEALGRGDLAGARALAAAVTGADARSRTRGALVRAMILRAEGRLDDAASALVGAVELAGAAGLAREGAAARLELAHVLHLGGRYAEAAARLDEAIGRVQGTSFRVLEVDLHVARGRYALLADDEGLAAGELSRARAAAAGVQDPLMRLRLAELTGNLAAASNDLRSADAAWREAVSGWESSGFYTEAARVAAEAVRGTSALEGDPQAWRTEATRLFVRAGDPLGPTHIDIADGLGRARLGDIEGAVRAFASAITRAKAVGGASGGRLAQVAEGNAGEALKRLQPPDKAVELARSLGLEGVLATQGQYLDARAAYERGTKAFQQGRFAEAAAALQVALDGFTAAGEVDAARTAQRSLGWARWNEASSAEPGAALATYDRLVGEARAVGDEELRVRSLAAAAIAAGRLKLPDAAQRLREGAQLAEQAGYKDLAGRCWAELANQGLALPDTVTAARTAFGLRRDQVGATAMYRAALAACNDGQSALCTELATEARPYAGDLISAFDELLRFAAQGG